MLVSYAWLKEFGDLKMDPYEMATKLTALGVEVEEVIERGSAVSGCVTGQLLEIWKHPEADTLNMTRVLTKEGEFEIVCGADNLKLNAYVVVALVGAKLPGGVEIKKSKIRGVTSNGMLCSKRELGLPQPPEDDGIYLLPEGTTLETPVDTFLTIEKDHFFRIEITSNRSDCSNIYGLAREMCVIAGVPFKQRKDPFRFTEQDGSVDVVIENSEFCRRYSARIIKNITLQPSSSNISKRLEDHGMRPINNVVDIVNYTMLQYGQPMHAFDMDKISGKKIEVRRAKAGEKIVVIGGREIILDVEDYVIADAKGPIAIAGVIGGLDTAVSDTTKNILLEAAYFNSSYIRATSKRHKIFTDASYRFQRSIDMALLTHSSNYVTDCLNEYKGVMIGSSLKDFYPDKLKEKTILLEWDFIERMLGEKLEMKFIMSSLHMLGFELQQAGEKQLRVTVPTHRYKDINIEVDLVEEIARCYGYDKLKTGKFMGTNKNMHIATYKDDEYVDVLNAMGYHQILTNSFVDNAFYEKRGLTANMVSVLDPINVDESFIRADLFYGALRVIARNENKNNRDIGMIFEMGNVFGKTSSDYSEKKRLVMFSYGKTTKQWYDEERERDFYDIKGDVEELLESCGIPYVEYIPVTGHTWFHDRVCANIFAQGKIVGTMGIIRPDVLREMGIDVRNVFAVDFDVQALPQPKKNKVKLKPVSVYPSIHRDLRFIATKEFDFRPVIRKMKTFSKTIQNVRLVDIYEGEKLGKDKRSVVLSLEYNAVEKTLTREEVEALEKDLLEAVGKEFNIYLE